MIESARRSLETVTVIGLSKMGQAAADLWRNHARNVRAVDADPNREVIARELGVEFALLDRSNPDLAGTLGIEADFWHIATPTQTHDLYLLAAAQAHIPRIFVEKPSTESPEKSILIGDQLSRALVQVDYVERANPAVMAIRDEIVRLGFEPAEFFHWRSKDTELEAKILGKAQMPSTDTSITGHDLIHDISEVDLILEASMGIPISQAKVSASKMTTWRQRYGERKFLSGDVSSAFTLEFPGGIKAHIQGRGDSHFQRSFLILDRSHEVAFFGQTLTRSELGIAPFAVKIQGERSVAELVSQTRGGGLWTEPNFRRLLASADPVFLDLSAYNPNGLDEMIKNIHSVTAEKDLICPLKKAIEIEKIAASAYAVARLIPNHN